MKVKVFAKVNLTLAVGPKRGKFHPIDSIVTSINLFDTVEVTAQSDSAVNVTCDLPIQMQQNSAYRAAEAFRNKFATGGANIVVKKGIPVGAGLGGSSADAAATVYCLCKIYGIDMFSQEVHAMCAELGSDINFMLRGGLGRMQGKGDDLTFGNMCQPLYFALTVFDKQLSTAEVYHAYDAFPTVGLGSKTQNVDLMSILEGKPAEHKCCSLLSDNSIGAVKDICFNDLELAAQKLDSYANAYIKFATSKGRKATMTGSGSAYYIVYDALSDAERATSELTEAGFPTRLCRSVPEGITEI